MKVKDLIEILKGYPQDLDVACSRFSEQLLLEEEDIQVETHCAPRKDGWIQNGRPDKPQQEYLVIN